MKSFLAAAHCPVILVPQDALLFDNVIFSYDDHISSMQAIRRFSALFPWVSDQKVQLVSIKPPGKEQMDYDTLIRQYLELHYAHNDVYVLHGNVQNELAGYITKNKNSLVVMGAFGRNALSRLFKESLAFRLMESVHASLFISHA
jgi:nucleotide-binding universal stress UspA family protein